MGQFLKQKSDVELKESSLLLEAPIQDTRACHLSPNDNLSHLNRERDNIVTDKEYLVSETDKNDIWKGMLILVSVTITWGTYAPCFRFVNGLSPPIPTFLFGALYHIVGVGFGTVHYLYRIRREYSNDRNAVMRYYFFQLVPWKASFELALYIFMGVVCVLFSLKKIPMDRNSFEVQTQTVMSLTIQTIYYKREFGVVQRKLWAAACLSILGVVLMNFDKREASFEGSTSLRITGDALALLAALSFAIHVIRIGHFAPQTDPHALAYGKLVFLLAFYLLSCLFQYLFQYDTFMFPIKEIEIERSYSSEEIIQVVSIIFFTGFFSCYYAVEAQCYGMKLLRSPSVATVIFGSVPIWTSLFAYVTYGETLGLIGVIGAICILSCLAIITF